MRAPGQTERRQFQHECVMYKNCIKHLQNPYIKPVQIKFFIVYVHEFFQSLYIFSVHTDPGLICIHLRSVHITVAAFTTFVKVVVIAISSFQLFHLTIDRPSFYLVEDDKSVVISEWISGKGDKLENVPK